MKKEAIVINLKDIGINFQDCGPWRSYHLDTYGHDTKSMIENAWIEEIDQDGGTLRYYSLDEAENDVLEASLKLIERTLK